MCVYTNVYIKSKTAFFITKQCNYITFCPCQQLFVCVVTLIVDVSGAVIAADLLEKVGELVDKLFDLDEELMKGWITARPSEEGDAGDSCLDLAPCLLEAAKQLRYESSA